uniref:Membrane protein n=1 Tax=Carcinus maenas virus 1 TaxID=2704945 RepID=A0A6G9HE59_9VIRU|nr:membrane protein [Carcinus maenas virus 1]
MLAWYYYYGGDSGGGDSGGGGGSGTTTPSPLPAPIVAAAEEPPADIGKVDLRSLVKGSTLTFKKGWWVDGAYSNSTPSELTCATAGTCPGGGLATYVLGDTITKVTYTSSATKKVIGTIKLHLANGTVSEDFGTSQGASDYVNHTITEPRGIRHLWSKPDAPVLQHLGF